MNKTKVVLLIAVLTMVAFIIIRALYAGADGPNCCGTVLTINTTTGVITGTCGSVVCQNETVNATYCTYGDNQPAINDTVYGPCRECWAGVECTILRILLPLLIVLGGAILMVWNIVRKGEAD